MSVVHAEGQGIHGLTQRQQGGGRVGGLSCGQGQSLMFTFNVTISLSFVHTGKMLLETRLWNASGYMNDDQKL